MTSMLAAIMERLGGENGMSGPDFGEKFRQSLPLRSFQDVRDMANLVHFLASDDARFITALHHGPVDRRRQRLRARQLT